MKNVRSIWAMALVAAATLAGCGGGGGGGIGGTGRDGTMHVSLTDAPACGYDHVYVTVDRVRVNQSSTAADSDAGWSEVVLSPARRVDLLTLTNGVLEDLGQTQLPAGTYTQLRLVLPENSGNSAPFANSVVPTGGSETALATPSAQQSGLKINVGITVEPDKIADVVLDFDACKSVVKRGNSGQYNLKPVLSATTVLSDAGMRVVGYVEPALGVSSTLVSVQANGVPVKATVPDATGKFVLYPVPVGTYDVVVTAPNRATAVMTGVPVVTTAFTTLNSTALPIAPPATTMRTVTGTVTPATATVRATQLLTGGPTIEAAWGAVDATTGAFSFDLPIGAPVKTAYVANPTTLSFTADSAAAGKYTLVAASAGATKTTAIDVNNSVPPVTFTFP